MLSEHDLEVIRAMILAAYADLWGQQRALLAGLGVSGAVNEGRLEADAQIALDDHREQFLAEARSRFERLTAEAVARLSGR